MISTILAKVKSSLLTLEKMRQKLPPHKPIESFPTNVVCTFPDLCVAGALPLLMYQQVYCASILLAP